MNKGSHHSAETRAKMSAAHAGKKYPGRSAYTAERCALQSANLTGRPVSAETRAKMSTSATGRKMSDEAKAKISVVQMGKVLTPEHRAKISAAMVGRPHPIVNLPPPKTAETRRKLSQAWEDGRMVVPKVRRYTKLAQVLHAHLAATGLTLEPEIRFGRYTVDLYDREHHVAYEADGAYWHDRVETKKPGFYARRDEYLIRFYGLKVVHFTDKEIWALVGQRRRSESA